MSPRLVPRALCVMCFGALKRQKDSPASFENYSGRLNVSAHLGLATGHPRISGCC